MVTAAAIKGMRLPSKLNQGVHGDVGCEIAGVGCGAGGVGAVGSIVGVPGIGRGTRNSDPMGRSTCIARVVGRTARPVVTEGR
ncbi:MAG: hypothetical protein COV45_07935 [Deltaproteobacteria bacterium CG11_big_fil_rev_8_21_14_0_20_47_16]|nr:MAG: hypothetical protein COV45_07935 [Deltaproteobacteria bacterium CG11_big_fil_rev_8_21_14_0_20_47_16]